MTPQQRKAHADYLLLLLKENVYNLRQDVMLYGSVSKIDPLIKDDPRVTFDENTDYDFATPYDYNLAAELDSRMDWRRIPDLDYQDDFTVAIYEGSLGGSKVQLSLRQAYSHFVTAWDATTPEFYWKFLNKRSPTFIGKEGVQLYLNQFYYALDSCRNKPSSLGGYIKNKVHGKSLFEAVWEPPFNGPFRENVVADNARAQDQRWQVVNVPVRNREIIDGLGI